MSEEKKINDGGPAFPTEFTGYPGMTLRDYLAAKAMQGISANGAWGDSNSVAVKAYQIADAMLAEREK